MAPNRLEVNLCELSIAVRDKKLALDKFLGVILRDGDAHCVQARILNDRDGLVQREMLSGRIKVDDAA
jgi:hypothetical protein